MIRDIRTFFEQEEDWYQPKRISSFGNNNYTEYENNSDKSSNISIDEYLNKLNLTWEM